MKILNDIACNLNWIQIELLKKIGMQIDVENMLTTMVLKKKTLKRQKFETPFHSYSFENQLTKFQFEIVQKTTYET